MMKHEWSISDLKNSKRNQWYLDNGCSKYMTRDLTKFTSLKLKAEGHVTYGDNNRGRILGRGAVGTGSSTTIENVLYVEGLKHSLLSINQLCDKGYKVNFKWNGCTISHDSSSKVLFTGKRVNNIYLSFLLILPATRTWRNRFIALSALSTRLRLLQNHPQNLLLMLQTWPAKHTDDASSGRLHSDDQVGPQNHQRWEN